MRRAAVAALLLALAGCTAASAPPVEPTPVVASAAPAPQVPPSAPDTCGAQPLQSLIGRPRTEIPVPVRPELQRVVCTTCPMTQDFNENRLNVLFDADTGLIRAIRCG